MVAIFFRLCPYALGVAAGVRLGEAEGSQLRALRYLGQVFFLLLLRPAEEYG
jgi:hypothetical protein